MRQATRLELLHHCCPDQLTLRDLHILASLPALRRLRLVGSWNELADSACTLMPHVELVWLEQYEDFETMSAEFLVD